MFRCYGLQQRKQDVRWTDHVLLHKFGLPQLVDLVTADDANRVAHVEAEAVKLIVPGTLSRRMMVVSYVSYFISYSDLYVPRL